MTLHQALEILDVPPEAPPEDVRRAYLRKLKQHKPERDPEGFKRVRAAYEHAQAWQRDEASPVGAVPRDMLADLLRRAAGGDPDEPRPTGPAPAARSQGAPEPPVEGQVPLDLLRPPAGEARHPREPEPPVDAQVPRELLRPRPGDSRGPPEPEPSVEGQVPAELLRPPAETRDDDEASAAGQSAGELARLRERADAGDATALWTLAMNLVWSGELEQAAPILVRAFEQVEAARPEAVPPIGVLLDLLLAFNARGLAVETGAIIPMAEAWVDRHGLEIAMAREGTSDMWFLLRELCRLPAGFPVPVRCALAKAIRDGSVDGVVPVLRAFAASNPEQADAAIYALADRAPLLQGIFAPSLNPDAPEEIARIERDERAFEHEVPSTEEEAEEKPSFSFGALFIVLIVVVNVARLASCN